LDQEIGLPRQESLTRSSGDAEFLVRGFTTDELPESQRLSIWREEFARTLVRVEIEPLDDEPFRAKATLRAMPGFRMLSSSGTPTRLSRTPSMAAAGDDSIGIVISLDRTTTLSQNGHDVSLRYGDACCILTDDPGTMAGRGHLGLLFPRAPLVSRARTIADRAARRIDRESDALRLFSAYLQALSRMQFGSAELQRTVMNHVYDLAASVICPDRPPDEPNLSATAAARLELALAYINRHFGSPGLTIEKVAREQNISPRYLQRLIETTGLTFSERMVELRLQRAYALLNDARYAGLRVSDIAARSGFSDIPHFHRLFRKRFGETPGNTRADASRN
jgi:AraC-like DNA-binding protein